MSNGNTRLRRSFLTSALLQWRLSVARFEVEDIDNELLQLEMQRKSQSIHRCVARLHVLLLSKGWTSWSTYIGQQKTLEQQQRRAMMQWKYKQVRSCLHHWKETVVTTKRLRQQMNHTVRRMLHQKLNKSLKRWKKNTIEQSSLRRFFQSCARQITRKKLQHGFRLWMLDFHQEKFIEMKRSIAETALQQQHHHHQSILRNVTVRFKHRSLHQSFLAWKEKIRHQVQSKQVIRKAVARIQHRMVYRTFAQW